jgi:peptidoglycan/xylan/chitin deacetylase (PgdA/CDA1 family)
MYHHVRANPDPNNKLEEDLDVLPSNFEKQMNYLSTHHYKTIALADLFNPKSPSNSAQKNIVITFDDGYKDVVSEAYPILRKYGFTATIFPIVDLVDKTWYMTWNDLWLLQNAGWEIGSHTMSHLDLPSLSDNEAEFQIESSKKILESKMRRSINSFCYPSGRFNEKILQLVKDAGYTRAVTTIYGNINQSDEELELKRIRIRGSDQLPNFVNKLK